MSEKLRIDRKIGFQNRFYTKCINVILDSIGPSIILRSIYSASVKSYQYSNFDTLENIYYSSMATFTFMFLVNNRLVWRDMVHVMHMLFMFFAVFKILNSSFSEDNMTVHALDVFIENATKMV